MQYNLGYWKVITLIITVFKNNVEKYIQISTFKKYFLRRSVYITGLCSFMMQHRYLQNGSCYRQNIFLYFIKYIAYQKMFQVKVVDINDLSEC
jgi:hypothetical protein